MASIISVNSVSKRFKTRTGFIKKKIVTTEALKNIHFEIQQGELFGFLGPNGAGKTTLIKILTTLLLQSEGTAYICGLDIRKDAKKIRQKINVVFGGEKGFYGRLSGWDNLKYFANLYHIPFKQQKEKISHLLNLVGLYDSKDKRVEEYSRGMKQKLHIARALINEPEILFLDEPTIGLDPVSSVSVRRIVTDLKKSGVTIFLTTHYMYEAEELCDRVAFIDKGEIKICDTVEKIKKSLKFIYKIQMIVETTSPEFVKALENSFAGSIHFEKNMLICNIEVPAINDFMIFLSDKKDLISIIDLQIKTLSLEDAYIGLLG